MANVYSNARNSYYGITGYPTYKFDGVLEIIGGIANWASTAAARVDARNLIMSDFTIGIEFQETDGNYHSVVTVENVGGNTATNLVLQFVITESKLPIVWGGMSEQEWANRLMVPNQNGTALDFSGGNTQVVELDFNTSYWDVDNCAIVAFVQNNSTKEILQGTQKFLAVAQYAIDAEAKAVVHPVGEYCGSSVEPIVKIKNMGSENLTSLDIEYSINGETPQTYAWTGDLAFNLGEDVTLPEISFISQSVNTFEFSVSNPNGQADPNPDNDVLESTFDAAYAVSTNTVFFELKTDNYPEETTWDVKNSAGDVIYSGGPYNGQANTVFVETFEFADSDCYTFGIYDAYGDGICCTYGQGYYKLIDEFNIAFVEGGEFGSEEFTPFRIGGDPPPPPTGNCEGFDDLTVGGFVAQQLGGNWTTWSGAPGTAEDALVSDLYSTSPSNSILVEGTTDLVQLITGENITSGKWSYSLNIYVPTGKTGYFNLQKDVVTGTEWGFQVMFEDDMTMVCDGGAAGAAIIPYEYDTWYNCEMIVDIDNDWCQFFVDGNLELEYQWTLGTFGTAGANTLAGSNIYANPGAGGTPPGAHFDDICFMEIIGPNADCEGFDDLTVGGYVAEQLGGMWTTWSGLPGGSEDAIVSDDFSMSPDNSFTVNDGGIDLIFQFGEEPLTTGAWLYSNYIYVPSGFSGYFNVQSEPTAGVDWVIELYFNDGGTGVFAGGSTQTFTYAQDTWFLVEINFDLDSDLAQVYFDGDLVIDFANELTIGGIDYYGSNTGGAPGAYYDDVCFGEGWPLTVGIEDVTVNSTQIYPNPANDFVYIQSDQNITSIRVFNYSGQLVAEQRVNEKTLQLNTSNFGSGLYLFQIITTEGTTTKQIIIQ